MRRADRLFRIVQMLRGGRLHTAGALAGAMEVSTRTIYRDVADLMASGVPIDGEAGVGYVMGPGFDLPPLMFTEREMAALTAGARLIRAWGGTGMALGAEEALSKLDAILPPSARSAAEAVQIHAVRMPDLPDALRDRLDRIEEAARGRLRLHLAYRDEAGARSTRAVRPLGLWFWGKVWTLVAWCELREDFRMFRIDRIDTVDELDPFVPEPGRTLRDFHLRDACTAPSEAPQGG